ncbi:hypothetical protein DFH28DRAFT_968493 [Melampsora americana]|nr:hypothetical protein DFH28DRAFT_968493 [Melampsora americana]
MIESSESRMNETNEDEKEEKKEMKREERSRSDEGMNQRRRKRSIILELKEPDLNHYPIYLKSSVIKGFGRGSKELNCPTANLNIKDLKEEVIERFEENGIYFGFCKVMKDEYLDRVFQMVMSIGFNPVYGNEFKTMEVHVMFEFDDDFYHEEIKVMVLGYIRPEYDYISKDALIADIEIDKEVAKNTLNQVGFAQFANDQFFS